MNSAFDLDPEFPAGNDGKAPSPGNEDIDSGERFAYANGLSLCHECFGRASDPVILLIHGLGAQMIIWADEFCEALAARGFRVIRFDNRDCGRSSVTHATPRDLLEVMLETDPADEARGPYSLDDMGDDAVALLDALDIGQAHVVGSGAGALIAQSIALRRPERVSSLTSINCPGLDSAARADAKQLGALFSLMQARTQDEFIEANIRVFRALRGPSDPEDEVGDLPMARRAARRGQRRIGNVLHFSAYSVSEGAPGGHLRRRTRLAAIRARTLVIQGLADPIVPPETGRAVAQAIPGAKLVMVEGLGHILKRRVWPLVIDEIIELARRE